MRGPSSTIDLRKELEIACLETYDAFFLELVIDDGQVDLVDEQEVGQATAGLDERPAFDALTLWGTNDPIDEPKNGDSPRPISWARELEVRCSKP